uniref:S-layer homology domain-containing protein n=1 Tax=Vallitalea guaymasensis TaxID=1185412 RepID=UPI00272A6827
DGKKTNFESDEPIIIEIPINGDYENHKVVAVYIDKKGNAEIMEGIVVNGVMRFTTNHLSNYALMYVDKTFDDVTEHWGKIAVETLASREVINGKSETSFDPNGEITRAEFTTLIVRYFDFASQSKDNYSDIEADKWYTDNISIAKDNNILPKVYGNTFEPSKEITREEMMYILYKSLEVTDRLGNFDDEGDKLEDFIDNNEISSYAIKGAKYLISRDIINGNDNNIINPTGISTRAEVAQMLYNMIISKKN